MDIFNFLVIARLLSKNCNSRQMEMSSPFLTTLPTLAIVRHFPLGQFPEREISYVTGRLWVPDYQ